MHKKIPSNFIFKTILASVLMLAMGIMLLYLAVRSWQVGVFVSRGHNLYLASEPMQFILVTGLGGLFGLILSVFAPMWLWMALHNPVEGIPQFQKIHSKIFQKTRPSIMWLGLWVGIGLLLVLGLSH